ncbi:MAG: magnesium/cobalt transporter CorA [Pseudomonadota bacterium]
MSNPNLPSHKTGLPPGSLVHVGDALANDTTVTLLNYGQEHMQQVNIESVEELAQHRDSDSLSWVIVEGLSNVKLIEEIGQQFDIHQLVLEDILNTHQRPKFDEFDDYLFIVLKGPIIQSRPFSIEYEQISLLVFKRIVFAFKEKRDTIFDPIKARIETSKGRFRTLGADFLGYSILDTIIDQYFVLIDDMDDAVTLIEDELLEGESGSESLNAIQRLKREIVTARRYASPVRELINQMLRSESNLIDEKTHIYLRDASDHAIRIIESIELHSYITSGLLDIYISSVSNRMNEVMKVLTVFATIFIPMTFLTGIYGMNFDYMPELKWHWAYPAIWCVFITIPTALLFYFKRKKWL